MSLTKTIFSQKCSYKIGKIQLQIMKNLNFDPAVRDYK